MRGNLLKSLFFAFVTFVSWNSFSQCLTTQPFSSNTNFTVPAGVTSITIEVWGAGGGGGGRTNNGSGNGSGGGGGGGAFSKSVLTVSPGAVLRVNVGAGGGSNIAGGDSWVSTTANVLNAIILAQGGGSPGINNMNGALGGRESTGIYNVSGYNGGDGASGVSPNANGRRGGGGGGAAGPLGVGANGIGINGGSNAYGGGIGGTASDTNNADGVTGSLIGGGGSGAARRTGTKNGGTGARGEVRITYNIPAPTAGAISTPQTICSGDDPAPFTSTTAGTGSGTITYRWESAVSPFSSWSAISGATSVTFDAPSGLTATTQYRRITISTLNMVDCESPPTAEIQVTVQSIPTAGAIAGAQTICSGDDPAAFTSTTAGTGSGTITYRWESAVSPFSSWSVISGATSDTYDVPSGLTATTQYRRVTITTLNGVPCESSSPPPTLQITVTPNKSASPASPTPPVCAVTGNPNIIHTTEGVTGFGTATGLPAGVTPSFAGNTLTISGNPTQLGTFNYSIPLIGTCGPDAYATGTITVTNCVCDYILDTPGTSTFTIPAGVTSITVEAWGGGGRGGSRSIDGSSGGGGGGGYSRSPITVVPGQTYDYTVGAGGNNTTVNGGSTVFGINLVVANGGTGVAIINTTGGGAGGALGIGGIIFPGGNGAGAVASSNSTNRRGGGGGGAAGPSGPGSNGTQRNGGSNGNGGGPGGTAPDFPDTNGVDGIVIGGGGSGAAWVSGSAKTGGFGARGQIRITEIISAGTLSGSQVMCLGGTSTLSSTVSGGTWSSNKPTIAIVDPTTGVVTGVAVGSVAITYTYITSCAIATASRTVNVNLPLSAGTLSGIQEVCIGGNSAFSSSTVNGTWSSSHPAIATVTSAGFVTGISAGTATISYTLPASGGCPPAVATRTVTVTSPPIAGTLSGTQEVCVGGASTFSSSTIGGTWSSSSPTIATVNGTTGLVTGVAAGTATMTYTVAGAGGCANATAVRTVTVTAAPTAGTLSGAQDGCVGDTFTFSSTTSGGTWTSGNDAIATINSVTGQVTGVAAGMATMTYTVTGIGGCSNVTATRTFTVYALPIPTFTAQADTPVCIDEPVTYTTQAGMDYYDWIFPGLAGTDYLITSGGTDSDHTVTLVWKSVGSKSVGINYTDTKGCGALNPVFSDASTVQPNTSIDSESLTGQIICDGDDFAEISVTASGPGDLIYQWYKSTSPATSGGTPVGTDSDTYLPLQSDFPAIGNGNPLYYFVEVSQTDGCGNPVFSSISGGFVVKEPVQITVDPSITGGVQCFGDGFGSISVSAKGSNLSYQWYRHTTNSITGGTLIPGATLPEFTPPSNTTINISSYYYAVVTGYCGPETSEVSGGYLVTEPNTTITVDLNPISADEVRCLGDHTFSGLTVEATGEINGLPAVNFQWYRNDSPENTGGTAISGENVANFTPRADVAGTWYYYATASSDCGTVPTDISGVHIVNPFTQIDDENLDGQTICEGDIFDPISVEGNIGFSYYQNLLSYQWYSNTVSAYVGPSLVEIPGETDASFSPPSDVPGSTLYYFVVVSGVCGPNVTSGISGAFYVTPNQTVGPASSIPDVCIDSEIITDVTHATANATGIGTPSNLPAGVTASFDEGTQTVTISGTPTASGIFSYSIPVLGCADSGVSATGTITVKPRAMITAVFEPEVCSNAEFTVTPTDGTDGVVPAGTTFSWSVPVVTGGMSGGAAGSEPNSITGTLTNPTSTIQTATYTVTSTSGSCTGNAFTVTVTVNPSSAITDIYAPPICNGDTFTVTPADGTNGVVPVGTTYTWTFTDNPSVTGEAAQTTPQATISQTLTNTTNQDQSVTYTVTPTTSEGCTGDSFEVEVTVKPTPTVDPVADQSPVCSGSLSTAVNFTGNSVAGVVYNWTNNNPSIGLAASGSGNIPSFTTINTGSTQITATIRVIPTANGCIGIPEEFTITIDPTPIVTVLADYCVVDGNVELVASSSVPGTTWLWNTGATTPDILVDIAGMYTVTATSPTGCVTSQSISIAQELVVDGSFTNFNPADPSFDTEYTQNQNFYTGVNTSGLWPEGNYAVNERAWYDPSDQEGYHTNFHGRDHTNNSTSSRNFLMVNGSDAVTGTPQRQFIIWQQEVTVEPNTEYYFSAWAMNLNPSNPAVLQFEVNGELVGTIANLSTAPKPTVEDSVKLSNWVRFYSDPTWNSGDATKAVIRIINLNTAKGGNDFGLDDISFGTLSPFIKLTSAVGITDNQVVCENAPIEDITYSVGGGIAGPVAMDLPPGVTSVWNGVTLRFSGSPTVAGTYNYTIVTSGDCLQALAEGTIVVRGTPTEGTIATDQTLCSGEDPVALSSTVNGTGDLGAVISYRWESNTNLTTAVWGAVPADPTGPTYDPPVLSETTQYRRITIATIAGLSCESIPTSPVQVKVQSVPTAGVIAAAQTICEGGDPVAFTSTTDGTGDGTITYRWESSESPSVWTTISGANSAIYDAPAGLTATTQYRRITISALNSVDCESVPTAVVQVTVTPTNTVTPVNSNPTLCLNTASPIIVIHNTTGATGIVPQSASVNYNLPNGVTPSLNAGVLTISGTPTEMGVFNYSIPLAGGCGSVSATGIINVENPSYPIIAINVVNPPTGASAPFTSTFTVYSNELVLGDYEINYSIDGVNGGTDQTILVTVTTPGEFTFISLPYTNEGTTVLTINSIKKDTDLCLYFPPNNNTALYGLGCSTEFLKANKDDIFYVPANVSQVTIQVFGEGSVGNTASQTKTVLPGGLIYVVFSGTDVFATQIPPTEPVADRLAQAIVSTTGTNGRIVIYYDCNNLPPCTTQLDNGSQYVDSEGFTVLRFNAGPCAWAAPDGLDEFEVLVIGGGGGGGFGNAAGGGGGGAVVYRQYREITMNGLPGLQGTSFPLFVGDRGIGASTEIQGETGISSSFTGPQFNYLGGNKFADLTAPGGGGGGSTSSNPSNRQGAGGASGGGGAAFGTDMTNGGTGNAGQNGGTGIGQTYGSSGAGGGGASNVGGTGSYNAGGNIMTGGSGGSGEPRTISGEQTFYGAGGGGTASGAITNQAGTGGSPYIGPNGVQFYAGGSANNNGMGQPATTYGSGGGAGRSGGGAGFPGVVYIRYPNFRILSVEYLNFNVTYNPAHRSGDLSWVTAKEWENNRFEIERSVNNVKEWETIGKVTGAGYSDQPVKYAFQDMKLPLAGGHIFYRLKQFNIDGDSTYSDAKAIQVDPMPGSTNWRVYPNPTTGDPINMEMLDTGAYNDEKIILRVISATGVFDVIEGVSAIQLSAQLTDILIEKAAGIYTLEISWGENREYHKVILRR